MQSPGHFTAIVSEFTSRWWARRARIDQGGRWRPYLPGGMARRILGTQIIRQVVSMGRCSKHRICERNGVVPLLWLSGM